MSLVDVKITREINEHVPCQNHTLFQTKKAKTIPYFRLKQLENHTLKCGTYPYSLYMGVPPRALSMSALEGVYCTSDFDLMWSSGSLIHLFYIGFCFLTQCGIVLSLNLIFLTGICIKIFELGFFLYPRNLTKKKLFMDHVSNLGWGGDKLT